MEDETPHHSTTLLCQVYNPGKRVGGEGTYKKRKDGRWEAQYTIHTAAGIKRKSVYGRTKQEVAEKLRKPIAERDDGLAFDAENLTLAEYLKRWLEGSVQGSVAKSTFERYEQLSRVHIVPAIGMVKLKKLTPVACPKPLSGKGQRGPR